MDKRKLLSDYESYKLFTNKQFSCFDETIDSFLESIDNQKYNISIPEIRWESLALDDFIFKFENYCLRVEQMDKCYWWYNIDYNGDSIMVDYPKARTKTEALLYAELYFLRHFLALS